MDGYTHSGLQENHRDFIQRGKVLKYYRPDLDLFIETDASGRGIGMALLQSEQNERSSLYPIAYGSKTLTAAETRYANIERELLGVVSALEKFHYFTFGRPVVVLTDHKPLIAISKKALINAPPRLQRLLLRLNNYNVTLTWDTWQRDGVCRPSQQEYRSRFVK